MECREKNVGQTFFNVQSYQLPILYGHCAINNSKLPKLRRCKEELRQKKAKQIPTPRPHQSWEETADESRRNTSSRHMRFKYTICRSRHAPDGDLSTRRCVLRQDECRQVCHVYGGSERECSARSAMCGRGRCVFRGGLGFDAADVGLE